MTRLRGSTRLWGAWAVLRGRGVVANLTLRLPEGASVTGRLVLANCRLELGAPLYVEIDGPLTIEGERANGGEAAQ